MWQVITCIFESNSLHVARSQVLALLIQNLLPATVFILAFLLCMVTPPDAAELADNANASFAGESAGALPQVSHHSSPAMGRSAGYANRRRSNSSCALWSTRRHGASVNSGLQRRRIGVPRQIRRSKLGPQSLNALSPMILRRGKLSHLLSTIRNIEEASSQIKIVGLLSTSRRLIRDLLVHDEIPTPCAASFHQPILRVLATCRPCCP